jgi:hypothetical protein
MAERGADTFLRRCSHARSSRRTPHAPACWTTTPGSAPWLVVAAAFATVVLITGWWSRLGETARYGQPGGWSAGEVEPGMAGHARHLPTRTSAGPAPARAPAAGAVPIACTAEGVSLAAARHSTAVIAQALAAHPVVLVGHEARDAVPCTDGYFDRWSQTWFSRTATPIAAAWACVMPGRRSSAAALPGHVGRDPRAVISAS